MSDASMMNSRSSSDRCRTVVVSGVPDELCSSRMKDKLTIHFQCARSHGGDVEMVQYPTHLKGVAFVTFDNQRDADRVVQFNQVLKDKEFKEEHPITVYTYTPEVAFYAYADLDLSLYPEPSTLIATLRSNHRSVRIQPSQTKPGFVSAEGPFSELQSLRKHLLSKTQNQIDIPDDASSPYKASSLDKALRTDKARNLEKASMPLKAWSQDKASSSDKARTQDIASSLDRVASSDLAWTQREVSSSYKTLNQEKASSSYTTLNQDKASSSYTTLNQDKASSSYKASSQDKASSLDRVSSPDWTQGEALSSYMTLNQDKASSLDRVSRQDLAWTQEEALISNKTSSQVNASTSFRAWTQEEATSSYMSRSRDKASISDKARAQEKALSFDKALSQDNASGFDKAYTEDKTLSLYKNLTKEEALKLYSTSRQDKASSFDKSRSQDKTSISGKARTQEDALSFDKARTQEDPTRSYKASSQDNASGFDRAYTEDKTSSSYKNLTQEEASRLYKASSQDRAPRSSKASSQDNASSFDKSRRQDTAGQLKVDDMTITNGTNCVSFWLDTHIYKYMQMVERNEWDRCVGKYNVTAHAVSTGEITEVKLHGRCDGSVLLSAQGELETLVAKRQDTLRTQHIDCSSADAMEKLLEVCEIVQRIYREVCYFPSDSWVKVIGPSYYSHRFCEMVKIMTGREF